VSLPYNDIEKARDFFAEKGHDIAAVIVEPAAGNMGLVSPKDGFLQELRNLTKAAGALLICDEVINGFRFGLSSYSSLFADVEPDIITLGKVIGGGLPLAAVGGKSEYMDAFAPTGSVYQAGTLAGNPLAVAAGLKTLEILDRDNPYGNMSKKCAKIAEGMNTVAQEKNIPLHVASFGGVFTIFCSNEKVTDLSCALRCDTTLYAKIFHGLYERGIYIAPSQFECNFISAAHTNSDVESFIDAFTEVVSRI
jgi:glutamate-1-semialdehyde 2,1-aminomutase